MEAALRTICRAGLRALARTLSVADRRPPGQCRKCEKSGRVGISVSPISVLASTSGGIVMPNDVVRLPVRERKLHADPARSYTLPARYYTSPEIYKQEAEAIFFHTWQYAGHATDLPEIGSYMTCQILDQNII